MSPDRKTNAKTRGLHKNSDLGSHLASLTATFTARWNESVLRSAMVCTALLCSSNLLLAQADQATTPILADKTTFDETVAPFLSKYCADCHGQSGNESDVVLSSIRFDLAAGHDMELWKTVLRELHVKEMPPTASQQPEQYEKDADFFVMNILEKDTDVFRQLLTSDEYFIFNRATFRNTVYDFYKSNQEQLDAGQFPEAKQRELLQRLNLKGWHELNVKYNLYNFNKGFIAYEQLFGSAISSSSGSEKRFKMQGNLLDFMVDDIKKVTNAIPSSEHGKMNAYLHAFEELQVRHSKLSSMKEQVAAIRSSITETKILF